MLTSLVLVVTGAVLAVLIVIMIVGLVRDTRLFNAERAKQRAILERTMAAYDEIQRDTSCP